jgi:hypothetical protein
MKARAEFGAGLKTAARRGRIRAEARVVFRRRRILRAAPTGAKLRLWCLLGDRRLRGLSPETERPDEGPAAERVGDKR